MNEASEKFMKQLGNQRELVFRHLQDLEKKTNEHDIHFKLLDNQNNN